jgi:hypothetical protein
MHHAKHITVLNLPVDVLNPHPPLVFPELIIQLAAGDPKIPLLNGLFPLWAFALVKRIFSKGTHKKRVIKHLYKLISPWLRVLCGLLQHTTIVVGEFGEINQAAQSILRIVQHKNPPDYGSVWGSWETVGAAVAAGKTATGDFYLPWMFPVSGFSA